MSLAIEQKALHSALKLAAPIASRGRIGAMQGVHLVASANELTVSATDGEMSVSVLVPGVGKLDSVTVATDRLTGFVSKVAGPGTLEVDDCQLLARFGSSRMTVRSFAEDFPSIKTAVGKLVEVDQATAVKLGRILFAASKDPNRPILCGVGIDAEGWATCTDSYRLAATEVGPDLPTAIIPARAIQAVLKHADRFELTVDDVRATFVTDNAVWTTRLIEGQFPNWRQLVPTAGSAHEVFSAEVGVLEDAIERLLLSCHGKYVVPMRLAEDEGRQRLSVVNGDGESVEWVDGRSVSFDGSGLLPQYLLDAVRACGEEVFTLEVRDVTKPVIQRAEGWASLLMPVRVGLDATSMPKAKR